MATVGDDGGAVPRAARASSASPPTACARSTSTFTAQAFIITDLDDNQITAFHPGAMNRRTRTASATSRDIGLGIVAPDGREGMLQHARAIRARAAFRSSSIRARGCRCSTAPELARIDRSRRRYVAVNDYEARLLPERTGWSIGDIAERVEALIVTLRRRRLASSTPTARPTRFRPCRPAAIVDPTGCGDAYRAGLLYGIAQRLGLADAPAARIGDGRDQDRQPRRAEPCARPRHDRIPLSRCVRRATVLATA